MNDGPSSSKAFGELYSSAKSFLKALFRDLLRLPNLLLVDRKKYQDELRQRNEEIASLKQRLEAAEIEPSERDQYLKELQQYINELQLKNEEIVSLQKKLDESKAESLERSQYLKALQQSEKEIAALQEKLNASKSKETEISQSLYDLQQNKVRELQKSKEEIASLKEGLQESDDHLIESREYLQELEKSRQEIASLKEKLEASKAQELEVRKSATPKVPKSFQDRMRQVISGQFGEASIRKDSYQRLQQLVLVIADLEDAGDALSDAYDQYRTGRRNYAGGAPIGQLVSAVISFNKIWSQTKEAIQPLLDEQASMKQLPKESDGKNS